MKNFTLILGAVIILIANAFALIHSARNRMGAPDAEITLTNRELTLLQTSSAQEDSGVSLYLNWTNHWDGTLNWLDVQKLQSLGFDCSVNPADERASGFYQRQRSRRAFVALEYDGTAWQKWRDEYDHTRTDPRDSEAFSHLVPIDADVKAARLRSRHPEGSKVLILPALVGINLIVGKQPTHIAGRIEELQSSVHVPRPFSDLFPHPQQGYRVKLRYGTMLEPWVTGVDFPK